MLLFYDFWCLGIYILLTFEDKFGRLLKYEEKIEKGWNKISSNFSPNLNLGISLEKGWT